MFSQLPLNQVMSGMDLVPPNSDRVYIDLTGESSEDEPPLDAGAGFGGHYVSRCYNDLGAIL